MHFKEFFGISQIRTASDSNNWIKWVEKWYSCYWVRAIENKDCFMLNLGNFFDPFDNFDLLSAIIEF